MSVFAAAANIISSLAGLGQAGAGIGLDASGWSGTESDGKGIAATAASMSGDFGSLLTSAGYARFTSYRTFLTNGEDLYGGRFMGLLETGPTGKTYERAFSLVSWTLSSVQMLELTLGFGNPYQGASLTDGSQQFDTLAEQLNSAVPDEGWQGTASASYAQLTDALTALAQTAAQLDTQLAAVVAHQAEWVTNMRLGFGILKDVLTAALVVEFLLTVIAPAPSGPAIAKAFAITVSVLGIAAATSFITTVLVYSVQNAKKARALSDQYSEAAGGVGQVGSMAKVAVNQTGQSTVSSFGAVSAGMSSMSAGAGAAPVVADEGGVGVRAGADEAAGTSTPEAGASTPEGHSAQASPPSTLSVTVPTLAVLSAMSGQSAKPSDRLTEPGVFVTRAMGQLDQMAQTRTQGQRGAAPAEEPAALGEAGLDGGAGAAVGATGVQRAPVKVAAAAAGPQPRPVQR